MKILITENQLDKVIDNYITKMMENLTEEKIKDWSESIFWAEGEGGDVKIELTGKNIFRIKKELVTEIKNVFGISRETVVFYLKLWVRKHLNKMVKIQIKSMGFNREERDEDNFDDFFKL